VGERTGQKDGHVGIAWSDLLEAHVAALGTLTAVAWKLIEFGDDVASIERALRRLRGRGQHDGGVWGQRVLRVLGIPQAIEARVRWLALYHSPFTDLPVALCKDQVRLWDRPPVSESRARAYIQLGHASCALRERRFDDAAADVAKTHAALAGLPASYDDARVEVLLVEAYVTSRAWLRERVRPDDVPRDTRGAIAALLDRAGATLAASHDISPPDRACFAARLADQRGFQLNKAGDYAGARALFEALPDGVHPFASYRREAGLAYAAWKLGDPAGAATLVRRAIDHAGDGGYTRLRAMGLLLLARIANDAGALARARAIAERLEDAELVARVERAQT
jgi:hypothetical protein